MKLESLPGRHGYETVLLNGVALHSRYNPQREAERFLDGARLSAPLRAVVVTGEGLPYLSGLIARRFPQARVLALGIGPGSPATEADVDWIDVRGMRSGSLRARLRSRLDPLAVAALELITWEPARRLAPELIEQVEQAVLAALGDLRSELATVGSFGLRWLRNSLLNALLPPQQAGIVLSGSRALLATSGPSLSAALRHRDPRAPVVATSSAWHTLRSHAVTPVLLVHTDGGHWARRYLSARRPGGGRIPVLMPARAAVAWRNAPQVLPVFLRTGWIGEQLHPDADTWTAGTDQPSVALTMIDRLTALNPQLAVQLAGFDLMSRGLRSHARPHPNDRYLAMRATRRSAPETQWAGRVIRGAPAAGAWSDGRPGYRSAALDAVRSDLLATVQPLASAGRAWLPEEPVPLPPTAAELGIRRGRPGGAPLKVVTEQRRRPDRALRARHAREVITNWTRSCRDPHAASSELLLHLAPLELLAWQRGEGSAEELRDAALRSLHRLQRVVEAIHGGS